MFNFLRSKKIKILDYLSQKLQAILIHLNLRSKFKISFVSPCKRKVLELHQDAFKWWGICPIDDQQNRLKQWMHYAFGGIAGVALIFGFISNLLYAIKYFSIDIEKALYAVFFAVSFFAILVIFVSVSMAREKVTSLIANFQEAYDQSKLNELNFTKKNIILLNFFQRQRLRIACFL